MKKLNTSNRVYLYGLHACHAALLNEKRVLEEVWLSEGTARKEEDFLSRIPFLKKHKPLILDKKSLDRLLPAGAVHQGIVIRTKPLPTPPLQILQNPEKVLQIVVVLDQVTDPQNIGSILRLCQAFDVDGIVLPATNTPPETGAMAKVASGALEVIPRCIVPNLASAIRSLKSWGFWCVGLTEGAPSSLRSMDLKGKIAVIMGSEGEGMRALTEKLCDLKAFLPTSSEFSTLNVTMATAITLYEVFMCQHGKIQAS